MKQCTNCKQWLQTTAFGNKTWTNKDGSTTTAKKSHCRICISAQNLMRYHTNHKTKLAYKTASYRHRIKSYGLSEEDYLSLLSACNSVCSICQVPTDNTLHIDHCHKTGKVRGLLCTTCNTCLGLARDNPDLLHKMISYLEIHNE